MGIISWVVFGAIVGWLASMIMGRNQAQGCIGNIVVGVVGAFIGGVVYGLFSGSGFEFSWSIGSFIVAIIGAVILTVILNAVTGRKA